MSIEAQRPFATPSMTICHGSCRVVPAINEEVAVCGVVVFIKVLFFIPNVALKDESNQSPDFANHRSLGGVNLAVVGIRELINR